MVRFHPVPPRIRVQSRSIASFRTGRCAVNSKLGLMTMGLAGSSPVLIPSCRFSGDGGGFDSEESNFVLAGRPWEFRPSCFRSDYLGCEMFTGIP